MPLGSSSAESNEGYWAAVSAYHIEIRRTLDQWEYQLISLSSYSVLREGVASDFEQCRTQAVSAAKAIAPELNWDGVQWQPLHTGK